MGSDPEPLGWNSGYGIRFESLVWNPVWRSLINYTIFLFKMLINEAFIPASNESSAVLARVFDECREGQIPRCSAALQA